MKHRRPYNSPDRSQFRQGAARGVWRGHLPITAERLLPILVRATLDGPIARSDRILYTVCEFWAAIAARTLVSYIGSEIIETLQNAITAFSEIGAMRVAGTLNAAVGDLARTVTRQQRREHLRAIKEDVYRTKDAVDQLIARFAEGLRV